MAQTNDLGTAADFASAMDAEIKALSVRNTYSLRAIRRKYSELLRPAHPDLVLRLARELLKVENYCWIGYELIRGHPAAFERLGAAELEDLGQGLNSWWTVDAFARTLAGPAWLRGQVSDRVILQWARSKNRWWRRAALVSTVALNVRSHGGKGDAPRTLRVCRLLVKDDDEIVVKALSWSLRELVGHDAPAVLGFLNEYEDVLAARAKREVRNKLRTGLKSPRRHRR